MIRSRAFLTALLVVGGLASVATAAEPAEVKPRTGCQADAQSDSQAVESTAVIVARYVARYLSTFPTRATATGDHRFDRELENPTDVRVADWIDFNERTVSALEGQTDLDARAVPAPGAP